MPSIRSRNKAILLHQSHLEPLKLCVVAMTALQTQHRTHCCCCRPRHATADPFKVRSPECRYRCKMGVWPTFWHRLHLALVTCMEYVCGHAKASPTILIKAIHKSQTGHCKIMKRDSLCMKQRNHVTLKKKSSFNKHYPQTLCCSHAR